MLNEIKDVTFLAGRCRGAPEDNAFMPGKRVSPHDNLKSNWRVLRLYLFASLCDHAHRHAPPTEARVALARQNMDAVVLGSSPLLLATVFTLEHVLDDGKVSLNVFKFYLAQSVMMVVAPSPEPQL